MELGGASGVIADDAVDGEIILVSLSAYMKLTIDRGWICSVTIIVTQMVALSSFGSQDLHYMACRCDTSSCT